MDTDVEDVLWVRLNLNNGERLTLAVCYIPPESSSRGCGAEETLQLMTEQVAKFGSLAHSSFVENLMQGAGIRPWIVKAYQHEM